MLGNPRECRDHAKNCLRLAAEAQMPGAKAHFEALAEKWLELATDLDATVAVLTEAGVISPLEPPE